MKYGKNVLITVFLIISCTTQKNIDRQTETKEERTEEKYTYIKKTSKQQKTNFSFNLDSLLLYRYQVKDNDSSFFFAEIKNGKIEIVYINPKAEQTTETKKGEKTQIKKEEKKEFKKEVKRNGTAYIYLTFGLLFFICGIYIIYEIRKKFLSKI